MDVRLDASESVFFQRQLESIDQQMYEVLFPAFKARELVPTQPGVPDWAHVYTWRMFEKFGKAEFIANMADDLPRADAEGQERSKIIKLIGASYGWDFREIKAAAATGTDLDSMKARAARHAVEQKIDRILALGDADHNLEGLLNLTGAATFTPGTKTGGGTNWGTVAAPNGTADEILADLMGIAEARVSATKGIFERYVITLPIAQYNLAAQLRLGSDADTTVLEFARRNSPFIEDVVPWFLTETAGSGGVTRMACYPRDPSVVAGLVPMEYTPMAPQQKNLEFTVNAVAACGGVVTRYPVAIAYGDDI